MGNSESKGEAKESPRSPSTSVRQARHERDRSVRRQNPTTTVLHPTTSAAPTLTADAVAASSTSRPRSITASASPSPRPQHSDASPRSTIMGNQESKHQHPARAQTLPNQHPEKPAPSPSPQSVDVPHPAQHQDALNDQAALTPPMNSPLYGMPVSDFSRPPRLPLPIERDPDPGSPIATPQGAGTPMETADEVDLGQRPGSMLSSTTLDDDEVADIETFTLESDPYMQKVLTTLEWKGGDDAKQVYVTGTFVRWEKKFRMQRSQEPDGSTVWRLTAPLPTGTHHIKFLVDNDMLLSDQYPTTVDYTASLVNYVEIAAPHPAPATQPPAPAEPMPIPGAQPTDASSDPTTRPLDIRTTAQASSTSDQPPSTLKETAPEATDFAPSQPPASLQQPAHQQSLEHPTQRHKPAPKKPAPRPKYTSTIPDYLTHFDLYSTPEDERYRRATKASQHLPAPPSLPMFMSKSILNAATPHKDDASVLTMPNHTVLNHLATSSIRQGVLATSGTTRYKRKFLTTIMYKPTSDAG